MNRGVDCKDTIYEVTFHNINEQSLNKLMFVLEGLMPENHIEVHTSGEVTSFIITVYEELDFE